MYIPDVLGRYASRTGRNLGKHTFFDRAIRGDGERPTPFRLNKNTFPTSTAVNVHYFREWKNQFAGDSFAFDYHLLWKHSIVEPTGWQIARVLHEDIRDLEKLQLDGLVNCQVQRYFFPTGLAMDVTAKTLWNKDVTFETMKRDYFRGAYQEHASIIQAHMERMSELLDDDLLFTTNPEPIPDYEARLRQAESELKLLRAYVRTALQQEGRDEAVRTSLGHLKHGLGFAEVLLPGFFGIARGDKVALAEAYRAAADYEQRDKQEEVVEGSAS